MGGANRFKKNAWPSNIKLRTLCPLVYLFLHEWGKSAVEAESSLGMSGAWLWACGAQGWDGVGWGGGTVPFPRWTTGEGWGASSEPQVDLEGSGGILGGRRPPGGGGFGTRPIISHNSVVRNGQFAKSVDRHYVFGCSGPGETGGFHLHFIVMRKLRLIKKQRLNLDLTLRHLPLCSLLFPGPHGTGNGMPGGEICRSQDVEGAGLGFGRAAPWIGRSGDWHWVGSDSWVGLTWIISSEELLGDSPHLG